MDQYLDRLEERGAIRGRAEGLVEGRAEGRAEGRVEGRAEERAAMEEKDKRRVRWLFEIGNSPEDIAKGMEIDLKTVKEWLTSPSMA